MKKLIIAIAGILSISSSLSAQLLSGEELLDKAISYHDPNNSWSSFKGNFGVTMSTPDGKERISDIVLNLSGEYFQLISEKDGVVLKQVLEKGECKLMLNGNATVSEEDKKKHRLTCERANMYKNYYTYLYGLPMKLKDPGTIIDPKTQKKTFKGKEYMVLKVTYEEEVGGDIWYFYFDPKTYAMEVYQFFRDESKPDGEYILLTGEEEVSGIKMPKIRAWYYNKDDKYLGTDVLTKSTYLE
ncbi:hypothetical protein FEE95_04600 [Maribacter algarum]|uniref:Outer membrane lipoprotein-sorting protein n=1 Tax=Maribacter algarum (ex Zhang et al. 2020) TaxID=2578118 RepID=A0A5S3PUQ1_9FLAO|nr:DUF6503 family protein [Maribacter algarum]TMM58715.1 hypothetical protein FEE95_04600 [Maribacter algarum]